MHPNFHENDYLINLIDILNVKEIIGVGKYAHNIAKKVINEAKLTEIKIFVKREKLGTSLILLIKRRQNSNNFYLN